MSEITDKVISIGRKQVAPYGRPNKFITWYCEKYKKPNSWLTAPWCAMFASWVGWSAKAGPRFGEYAYCPTWVKWFKDAKRWGTKPKPGALVFFDWDRDGLSDHVGIVTEVLAGGKIKSLEGNTRHGGSSNVVYEQTRTSTDVLGYGYWDDAPVQARTYKVVKGDTLSAIGKKFGVAWQKIAELNGIADPKKLQIGTVLKLP